MNKMFPYALCCFLSVLMVFRLNAQIVSTVDSLDKKYLNWYNLDPKTDKIMGASVDKAYKEVIIGKTPKKKIIVALIDGGVDTSHAELKGKIWKNADEIAGNGIDDDKNGYIDDVSGWNFLGNSKGENINSENFEYTRIIRKFGNEFKFIKSRDVIAPDQEKEYDLYIAAKKKYDTAIEKYSLQKKELEAMEDEMDEATGKLKILLKKSELTIKDIEGVSSSNSVIKKAKESLLSFNKKGITLESLEAKMENVNRYLNNYLNIKFSPRDIIGDNPEDIKDVNYGNNDIIGPDASHGTMIAGVIAAKRDNKGIDGIADNVQIMAIRAIPDGDERDKDVALAIRYAVDNGANIINMSFRKTFSTEKKFVDEALLYAEKHGVLLVHGAGNEGLNNDSTVHYPVENTDDGKQIKNMLEVGASNMTKDNEFAGMFSNYGQDVDLFAPGINMISIAPANKYTKAEDISFACPVASGIAALVWTYYPELTALQLKEVLTSSVVSQSKLKVLQPGNASEARKPVLFSTLCKTGGIINAASALSAAESFINQKKMGEVK